MTNSLALSRPALTVASVESRELFRIGLRPKRRILRDDPDAKNQAAILGEVRAFGELIAVWGESIEPRSAGGDFKVEIQGKSVGIEVLTVQGRAARTKQELGEFQTDGIRIRETKAAPLGLPQRDKDTVQGEAVSFLASRKDREHQFVYDVSVFWIDLQDPDVFPLGFGIEQFAPLRLFVRN